MVTKAQQSAEPKSFQRELIRTAIFPLIALGLFLIISWLQINSVASTAQWVDHTDQVIAQAHTVQELALDMETGLRGYLLTGSSVFLEPYQNAQSTINVALDTLEQLVTDNLSQSDRVKAMRSQFGDWQKFAKAEIATRDGSSSPSLGDETYGKQLMDQLRQQILTFTDTESTLRVGRVQTAQQTSQAVIVISVIIALILGVSLALFVRNQLPYLSNRYENALKEAYKQAEDARLQREWVQRTLSSIGDGIIATDTQGKVLFINRVAETLTNWRQEQARDKPLSDVFKVVNEATREPIMDMAVAGDDKLDTQTISQVLLVGKAGQETPIENSVAPIRDAKNAISGTVYVFRDMNERRRAAARLLDSEKRYRDLTSAMPLILWTATPTGEVDYYNQKWFEYTGLTPEQSKSMADWQVALHPDDVEHAAQQWDQALKTGQRYEIEYRWKRATDGVYLWHLGRAVPINNDCGEIAYWVGTLTDIDRQKQSETTLKDRTDELELTAARLEERNSELDQFAYVTSHDLKAPLRGIANLSQWIEEDLGESVNEEIHKQMELLRGRVHRMEGLIDGILQYSRVGRVKGSIETVNVETLLKDVIDLLSPPQGFSVTVEPGMPTLRAERLMLQQVFSNLIQNAIKHHNSLGGHIAVGIKDSGRFYEFTVADDGPGIAPEFHQKIFVIFQTLESRDKVEGSGLGLALVKKMVDQQGGKIWLESALGTGSTFHFTWPKRVKEK